MKLLNLDKIEAGRVRSAGFLSAGALGAIGLLATAGPVFAQNLLGNSGFEDSTLDVWTSTGNVVKETYADYTNIGGSGQLPAYGSNIAAFNSGNTSPNAILAQSFATTAGKQYTVSFLYGNFSVSTGPTTQAISASVYNGALTASSISSSAPTAIVSRIFTASAAGTNENYPTIYGSQDVLSFVATGSTTTLSFADQPTTTTLSSDGMLDNVNAAVSAPEPGPLALISVAGAPLLGTTLRRRLRRRTI